VNGWLVDRPSADAIAEAIARIAADAVLRRRLIANGYETARRFTLEAQAERMMSEVSARLRLPLKQPAGVPVA
jgi:glycosyltransferase involved in cell wall biosynthesis